LKRDAGFRKAFERGGAPKGLLLLVIESKIAHSDAEGPGQLLGKSCVGSG